MNKAELKKNITKINKLLRSEELVVGIELIKSYNEAELNKAVAKTIITVLKKKFVKAINTSKKSGGRNFNIIDENIALVIEFSNIFKQKDLFDCLIIDTMKNLKYKDALKNKRLDYNIPLDPFINPRNYYPVSTTKQPYYDYIIWNLIGYLTPHIDIKECKIISYSRYRSDEWYVLEKFPEGLCNINSLESLEIVGGRNKKPGDNWTPNYLVHTSLNGGFNIPDTISNLGNLKEFYCNLLYYEKDKERIQELLPNVYIGWKDIFPIMTHSRQCKHCGDMCSEDSYKKNHALNGGTPGVEGVPSELGCISPLTCDQCTKEMKSKGLTEGKLNEVNFKQYSDEQLVAIWKNSNKKFLQKHPQAIALKKAIEKELKKRKGR